MTTPQTAQYVVSYQPDCASPENSLYCRQEAGTELLRQDWGQQVP